MSQSCSLLKNRYGDGLENSGPLLVVMALLPYNAVFVTLNALHKHPELDPPYCKYKDQQKILLAQSFPALANSIIKHERHRLWDGQPTIYAESPSPEVDAAWEDLLSGISQRTYNLLLVC